MSFTIKPMRRALAAAALVGAVFCVFCSSALADGDPASDYLLSQQTFVLLQTNGTPPSQKALSEVVAKANKAGYPIRVAVISSEYDLGSVSVLWGKPRTYARFLGIELSLAYKGLLLVAMPSGFGINWPGHSTAAAYKALAGVKVPAGEIGTITAAQAAVQRLASAGDVSLASGAKDAAASGAKASAGSSSSHTASSSSGVSASTALLIGAAVMLVIAFGAALVESRRRAAPALGEAPAPEGAAGPRPAAPPASRASGMPLKWALPRMAALFAVAVAVPIVAVGLLRHSSSPRSSSQDSARAVTQETPFTWGKGQRVAPNFTLLNQNGQAVSPAAYHGRPLIITFIDPLCRNLCPLEAKVLNEADERLPVDERPQIIAVSVDIYADTHTDLMLDFRRWGLVPQWQWAVGTPAQLQAVWKRYYAEVEVQTKHIAGTTVHYITHSEMAYVVDGKGDERALFSWPFNAKAVQKTLMEIERS